MKEFYIAMMCSNCKNKITKELNKHGYHNFEIDMGTGRLIFEEEVSNYVEKIVSRLGYHIEAIKEFPEDDINEISTEDIYGDFI